MPPHPPADNGHPPRDRHDRHTHPAATSSNHTGPRRTTRRRGYVLNMLELSWGGTKAHTNQGFNIGKPPYGYAAVKTRHPVKNKAEQGRTKHRLVPDPVRGPVVTRIFLLRALDRIPLSQDRLRHPV